MTEKATVVDVMKLVHAVEDAEWTNSRLTRRNELESAIRAIIEERDALSVKCEGLEGHYQELDYMLDEVKAERDQAVKFWHEIIADFQTDAECLPKCDSFGHEEFCPAVNAWEAFKKLKKEHAAAIAQLLPLMIERDQALKDCEDLSAQNEELCAAFIRKGICSGENAHWCISCLVWGIDPEPIAHKPDCVVGRMEAL